jgi:hypothetical protein
LKQRRFHATCWGEASKFSNNLQHAGSPRETVKAVSMASWETPIKSWGNPL